MTFERTSNFDELIKYNCERMNTTSEESVQTIDDLIAALCENKPAEFPSILRNMNLAKEELRPYQSWSKKCYTRNCIFENDDFELILLCWEGNQKTQIHDHGGENCWVYFLDDEFEEEIYAVDDNENPVVLRKVKAKSGYISFMNDEMGVHRLKNCSDTRGMSLHLYAKPIDSCSIFDEDAEEFSIKEMSYDTTPDSN